MKTPAPEADREAPQTAERLETNDAIDTAIDKSDDDFIRDYLRPRYAFSNAPTAIKANQDLGRKEHARVAADFSSSSPLWPTWTDAKTGNSFTLSLVRADDMAQTDMQACFDLICATSGHDYRASAVGWHPAAKRREMASPELRYVLVRSSSGHVDGFASLMPTYEDDEPVVYLYEIHLEPELQGIGLGPRLMELVMQVADNIPSVTKVMLTCFTSNKRACAFYRRLGFVLDDSSPRQRKLRAGRVVCPDYAILSRPTASSRARRGHDMAPLLPTAGGTRA